MEASAVHVHTPSLVAIDPRGLFVREVAYHRRTLPDVIEARISRQVFDSAGRSESVWDPRLFERALSDESVSANQFRVFSLSGLVLMNDSVDAGWQVTLSGETAQRLLGWDGRGSRIRSEYDSQRRPQAVFEQIEGECERCVERLTYAAGDPEAARHNQCGRPSRHDDCVVSRRFEERSMAGELMQQRDHFLNEQHLPDWQEEIAEREHLIESGPGAITLWQFGPQGEPVSQTDAKGNTQTFAYTVSGQLHSAQFQLSEQQYPQMLVGAIQYNAFGQVEREILGNGVICCSTYCSENGRLTRLTTRKPGGKTFQDLRYAFDPVGNITQVEDLIQPIRYFANQRIEPLRSFEYDTLYQLTKASGWEVRSATSAPGLPGLQPLPVDSDQQANYVQNYFYDAAGNLLELRHVGSRNYTCRMLVAPYSNRSLLEAEGRSRVAQDFDDAFDKNGNLRFLQPGQELTWTLRDQLRDVTPVCRENGNHDTEWYGYDATGQRVRKIHSTLTHSQTHIAQTRYLPGLELRTNNGTGETLEVLDVVAGRRRVRILHWTSGRPECLLNDQIRYSIDDHLGSSMLELDASASILNHEVYYPYGGTAWWAARSQCDARCKFIHYSGKELDATGLYYYGSRYYAPWICRWISPDPAGVLDSINLFEFVRSSPVGRVDLNGRCSKKFRGEAGDRVERELLKEDSSTIFIARGLKDFEGQSERRKVLAEKIRMSLDFAANTLESALSNVENQPRSQMLDTVMKALLGNSEVTISGIASIASGFAKILNSIRSRMEPGNDQIVIYESASSESGYVRTTDEHARMFVKLSQVEGSDVSSLGMLFIHEVSHQRLKTEDVFYSHRSDFGFPRDDRGMVAALTGAIGISMDVGAKGEQSSRLNNSGAEYRAVKFELQEKKQPITNESIFLRNADTWASLAVGLAGYQVISKYRPLH